MDLSLAELEMMWQQLPDGVDDVASQQVFALTVPEQSV